jgi:hypothetical protein
LPAFPGVRAVSKICLQKRTSRVESLSYKREEHKSLSTVLELFFVVFWFFTRSLLQILADLFL